MLLAFSGEEEPACVVDQMSMRPYVECRTDQAGHLIRRCEVGGNGEAGAPGGANGDAAASTAPGRSTTTAALSRQRRGIDCSQSSARTA
jgi:hypothetical protein